MNFVYGRIQHNLQKSDAILKNIQDEYAKEAEQYRATEEDSKKYNK